MSAVSSRVLYETVTTATRPGVTGRSGQRTTPSNMLEVCRSQRARDKLFSCPKGFLERACGTPVSAHDEATPLHWQPREPPLIVVDDSFVLDRWRPADGPALRRFDLDPYTARFFGYSVEQAAALPDSHYDGDTRARGNLQAWREGRQLNLAIRRRSDGDAVGWVELQRAGEQDEVSYNVTAELRGQGIAPRALSALLVWPRARSVFAVPTWPVTSTTWPLDGSQKSAGSSWLAKTATSTSLNGSSICLTGRPGLLWRGLPSHSGTRK